MPLFSYLPFAAAAVSLLLALASLLPKKRSPATWCFFAGMALLGVDSLLTGLILQATEPSDAVRGLTLGLIVKSFLPAAWLGFSLTYSRGDYRGSVGRWIVVATLALLPVALSLGFHEQLIEVVPAGPEDATLQLRFGAVANTLNVILLVALVCVLMNLEQTFRSAVGATRWQVKFVVLGMAVIFAAHVYVRSQALIFSAYDMDWSTVKSSALLIGCVFLGVAYLRTRFAEVDLYPSRAVLRSSLTVLIAGGYLLTVGVLAKILKRYGRADSLELDAFLVLA